MNADLTDARRLQARALAAAHGHYAYTLDECEECSAKLAAWDAQSAVMASSAPPSPVAAPTASDPVVIAPAAPTTPEALHAALDAAPDEAVRARVLDGASPELRSQFHAMLVYRKLKTEVELAGAAQDAALAEFAWQLDTAATDDERRALITDTDRELLSEWKWRRNATNEDWQQRYMALANDGDGY